MASGLRSNVFMQKQGVPNPEPPAFPREYKQKKLIVMKRFLFCE